MSETCPYLPSAEASMDYRSLQAFRNERGAGLYLAALQYAQFLWGQGLPARAILALDRALFCDLSGDEPILREWPLPYAALGWILARARGDGFLGNPRVSFQHLAGRVRGERVEIRRWRAWACWAIVRHIRPELPADPHHEIREPSLDEIAAQLEQFGLSGEVEIWREALASPTPQRKLG